MNKVKVDVNAFVYPMPMVLVGAMVGDRPNFLAVAWVSRVNYKPPMIGIALGATHYTNPGIHANRAFSVNVPGTDLVKEVDYCGLVSGKNEDKSGLFTVFSGEVTGAPMIEECPLCLECRLIRNVELGDDELLIGEIVGAYADKACLTAGKPDVQKINPFMLTMPDNNYWTVGKKVGKAWSVGKGLRKARK